MRIRSYTVSAALPPILHFETDRLAQLAGAPMPCLVRTGLALLVQVCADKGPDRIKATVARHGGASGQPRRTGQSSSRRRA